MAQSGSGFLEHLYHGRFRDDLFHTSYADVDSKKVNAFLADYQEAVKGYSGADLEKKGRVPPELLDGLKKIGIFGLTIPESKGGLGMTLSEYLRVVERMSQHDLSIVLLPLAHLSIGMKGITLFGNDSQQNSYLPRAASGEMVFSYALTEPDIGSDAAHVQTVAEKSEDGAHYILNGTKTYITNANYAGAFTVFAQLDPDNPGNMAAFIVEREWPGISVMKDMPKMGLKVSSTAAIRFKDVKVPAENLLGQEGDGFKIAMTILNYGRLGLGAASAGLLSRSAEDMRDRAESRTQFGQPIIEYELIQEKIAQAEAHAFASRAMTRFTANLLESDMTSQVAIESSHCKLYGTTRCWDSLYDAMQTAGGSGYLSTQPYEKRMRDFRVTTIFEGTTEIHSIYPALTMFRDYGKEMKGKSFLQRLVAIEKINHGHALSRASGDHPLLNRSLAVARSGERKFRRLLAWGMLRYGTRIVSQEFYLRRMTMLSISVFTLVSAVSYLQAHYNGDYPQKELALLQYLTEESRELQKENGRKGRSARERVHPVLIKRLREQAPTQ